MSYKSKWIDSPDLRQIERRLAIESGELHDHVSMEQTYRGDYELYTVKYISRCSGAYGANVENKLRLWGHTTAQIMGALADAFGWSDEERENYPQCDQ